MTANPLRTTVVEASAADTPAGAADTVRQLVALAEDLLDAHGGRSRHRSTPATAPARAHLERVTRLRDALHVIANRVARFDVDEFPILAPVHIASPTVRNPGLTAEHLLVGLEWTSGRLIALLDRLSPRDWARRCWIGDQEAALGELVASALDHATQNLAELEAHNRSLAGRATVAVLADRRSRRRPHARDVPSHSPARKAGRGAQAS